METDKKSSGGFLTTLCSYLPFSTSKTTLADRKSETTDLPKDLCSNPIEEGHRDAPVEREDLGRNTWSLLHTMAAYLPEEISNDERKELSSFMHTLGKFYPCDVCAHELNNSLKANPPDISSRSSFCQWMCRLHNGVNERLGKPLFDCTKVDERWRDGWED